MFDWFIITLLTTISVGIVAFINKIFAERKYDERFSAMVLYGIVFFFSLIYLSFFHVERLEFSDILLSAIWGVQICSYSLIMMVALKYLPTSTYFISVRLLSSVILLVIGIIFFGDIISRSEIIGLVFGFPAMMLLFEKEQKENLNYKKGIFVLILGVLSLALGHSIAKIFSSKIELIPTVLAFTFFISFFSAVLIGYKTTRPNRKYFKLIFIINFWQASLFFFYFIMIFRVYGMGNLGISYKIQSYSPFIPIILSSIIYKEKITKKKMVALVLTIFSLWFFA